MEVPHDSAAVPPGRTSGSRVPLRWHLLALVVVSLLPALAVGGVAAVEAVEGQARAFEQGLREAARAMAGAVDAELSGVRAVLVALSGADDLTDGGDIAGFASRQRETALALGYDFVVLGPGPGYPVLMDTGRGFGTARADALRAEPARSRLEQVFATAQAEPLPLTRDADGRWITGLIVPVTRGGKVRAVMLGLVPPERISTLLAAQPGAGEGVAALLDDQGRIVARSRHAERFLGTEQALPAPASRWGEPPPLLAMLSAGREGRTGIAVPLAHAPSWRLILEQPRHLYWGAMRRPLIILVIGGLGALAAAAGLALLLSRGLVRPVLALTAHAAATAAGGAVRWGGRIPDAGVREFADLRRSLIAAAALLAERREAAQAAAVQVEQQRALLQAVLDSLPDAVWLKDRAGGFLAMNEAALALTDAPGEPPPPQVPGAGPAPVAGPARPQGMVLRSDIAERGESERRMADGSVRRFATLTVPWMMPGDDAPRGTLGVARDVTAERRNEAELRQLEMELGALSRRASASALASGLAHELNQPLAAAANYLNVARRLLPPARADLPPSMPREALDAAAGQILRAGEIIRRLRDFLAGRPLDTRPEAVAPLLAEAARLATAARADSEPVPIALEVEPDLPPVPMDRIQVQQVLLNLLRNAMEAMDHLAPPQRQAGIVLNARLRASGQGRTPGWLDVAVVDGGPGPPPDLGPGFVAFRTTKNGGMGLGLAICRDIATAHGGLLRARPGPGGTGVQVVLSLPLPQASEPPDEAAA